MTQGPFHLVICPGAWCPASQWAGFAQSLGRSSSDVLGVSTAQWPVTGAGLLAHRDAVLAVLPAGDAPIVLLGHSFGTLPMLEAGLGLGARLAGAIVVDGFLPEHGLSAFAQSARSRGPEVMRVSAVDGTVPPPDPTIWGLRGAEAKRVANHLQPHSLSSLEEGISADAAVLFDGMARKAFIGASAHQGAGNPFKRAFDGLEGRKDWFSVQIQGGHLLHIERPDALAYWCAQFLRMAAGKGF